MVSKNRFIIVIILVIVSFFICRYSIKIGVSIIEVISSSILYPLLCMQHTIVTPIAEWFEYKATVHELENKLIYVQRLNKELSAENNMLKSLYSYNCETKELRDFNKRYKLCDGHLVQILARHCSSKNQFFFVNAGVSSGIKKDMVALYGNNIIGKVIEVYPWYSKVCLITDADCKVAAMCLSKSIIGKEFQKGPYGILEGTNDATYTTLQYVSHLEAIEIGDMVFSSGEGLVFPKGFMLGNVVEVRKGDLFYTIRVNPLLDLQTLDYCTLIAKEEIER